MAKTKKYDNNPALKGGQKNLPDALQKGIIKSKDPKALIDEMKRKAREEEK
jgi:hypothetical protein|tara:strand:+ start:1221 stop:1373 length:153 start_codon:yes stop_codon:yes gene_type:complete